MSKENMFKKVLYFPKQLISVSFYNQVTMPKEAYKKKKKITKFEDNFFNFSLSTNIKFSFKV